MNQVLTELPAWAKPVGVEEEEEEQTTGSMTQLPSWAKPVETQTPPESAVEAPQGGMTELPAWAEPAPQEEPVAPLPEGEYTPSDLTDPRRMAVIDNFLKSYYGTDKVDGYSDDEKVDQFLNTFRYLQAGNTVKTIGMVDHVLSTDEEGRKAFAEGYDLFEGLGGDYTFRENLEMVKDYAIGAIVDPVNIVAPLVGKLVGQTGTTATSRFALAMARREAARMEARGASRAVQIAAGNKVKAEALRRATARVGKAQAYKEVMGAAAFDTAVAVGTDIAYQHGLIQAGAQEEQNRMQSGFAAIGGIIGGSLGAALVATKGVSKLAMAGDVKDISVANAADLNGVLREFASEIENIPDVKFTEIFGEKVKRGIELSDLDTRFWGKLLGGDDPTNFRGLGQILYDRGFRWLGAREEGDNFTNWFADAMIKSDPEDTLAFVKALEDKIGLKIKDMDTPTINQLADNMTRKISDSGYALGVMGNLSQMMKGKDISKITIDDYMAYRFGDVIAGTVEEALEEAPSGLGKIMSAFTKATGEVGEGIKWGQNTYIRLLVTHPGTSALNIIGWSAKSIGQSASDIIRGTVLYGGSGMLKAIKGNGGEAMADWSIMSGMYKANWQKIKNLIDPTTTADAFNSLIDKNPNLYKDIVGVLPGGVTKPAADLLGVTKGNERLYQVVAEKGIDGLQTLGLVKAQDVFTKSQELMYNLDIALREAFKGKGYNELISGADASIVMSSKQWKQANVYAVDRTLDNILSRSYLRHDNQAIRQVGGFIEEFRSIPVVGATIPFGRFFNNVVGTMSEYSGLNIPLKMVGFAGQKRTWGETIAKPTVAWVAASMMVDKEIEYLERGINWDESIEDSTGQRFSERFNAPVIGIKALSRWLAYKETTGEVPTEFIEDASQAIIGQLTRQLSESGDAFLETVLSVLTGNYDEAAVGFSDSIRAMGSTVGSGMTRFMEPVNSLVALGSTPLEYMAVDVKTGNPGFAKAFRYIDQLIPGGVTGDVLPAQSPTSEYVGRQPSRLAGQRPSGPTTYANRVFATVGRPAWDAGMFADDKVAQNIVVGTFQPIMERMSETLWNNKAFQAADLATKQDMLSDTLARARKLTHRTLQTSSNPTNPRLSAIFTLTQNNSVTDLEAYMKDLGMEQTSIHELTTPQLQTLKHFVDNDKDYRRKEVYRRLGQ